MKQEEEAVTNDAVWTQDLCTVMSALLSSLTHVHYLHTLGCLAEISLMMKVVVNCFE